MSDTSQEVGEPAGRLPDRLVPERDPLSYAQFSEPLRIVADDWKLFEPFLPPKPIWDAKLQEVSQVRNRLAHFRRGHHDDLQHVVQLPRDLDHGFLRFCTSYNDPHPIQSEDPVEAHFLHLDPFPWGEMSDGHWARTGIANPEARLGVTVEVLHRPWAVWSIAAAGTPGLLYDVTIHARRERHLDYCRLVERTPSIHEHVVHVCLDGSADSVRVTIPAMLGADRVIKIVKVLHEACLYCLVSGFSRSDPDAVQRFADSLPEFVLGPESPLTFLSPDMPCSFFGA